MWIIFITNKDHTKLHPYYILLVVSISCLFLLLDGSIPDIYGDTNFHRTNNSKCNCVVFRMDDIQDYWLNSVQSAVMDLFLSKGQNLSLGLITHAVGNDSKIVDKIEAGLNKRLFELDVHGWDHVNYSKLSQNEQKVSLYNASSKIEKIFGIKPDVFIPPSDSFDNNTIWAMKDLRIKILSSGLPEERRLDQNKNIFSIPNHEGPNNSKIVISKSSEENKKKIIEDKDSANSIVYDLPATVLFKDFKNGKWVKTQFVDIIGNVTKNISEHGYAVVVLHPQDFAHTSNGTSRYINSIDKRDISDLANLIDYLVSRNVMIVPFSKVIPFSQ